MFINKSGRICVIIELWEQDLRASMRLLLQVLTGEALNNLHLWLARQFGGIGITVGSGFSFERQNSRCCFGFVILEKEIRFMDSKKIH